MDISWAQLALERLISLQMAAAVVGDLGRYTTDMSGVEETQNQEEQEQDDANSTVSTSSDPNQLESTGNGVLVPSPLWLWENLGCDKCVSFKMNILSICSRPQPQIGRVQQCAIVVDGVATAAAGRRQSDGHFLFGARSTESAQFGQ